MPAWVVMAIAVGAAFMVFDVEFRSEVYTFTFGEIVLVLGLFFATPLSLIVGRLVGELLFLTLREHQPLRKLAMNLSAIFAETVVLLTVQQALFADDGHSRAAQLARRTRRRRRRRSGRVSPRSPRPCGGTVAR